MKSPPSPSYRNLNLRSNNIYIYNVIYTVLILYSNSDYVAHVRRKTSFSEKKKYNFLLFSIYTNALNRSNSREQSTLQLREGLFLEGH